jgi:type I restriction enzyme M protein
MSEEDEIVEPSPDEIEEDGPDNFYIDILTGNKESPSPKSSLCRRCCASSLRVTDLTEMTWG